MIPGITKLISSGIVMNLIEGKQVFRMEILLVAIILVTKACLLKHNIMTILKNSIGIKDLLNAIQKQELMTLFQSQM